MVAKKKKCLYFLISLDASSLKDAFKKRSVHTFGLLYLVESKKLHVYLWKAENWRREEGQLAKEGQKGKVILKDSVV